MSAALLETILPSLIVTLFSGGLLTLILRRNGFHALLGLALMSASVLLMLSEVGARTGKVEGSALALLLSFLFTLHILLGWLLLASWKKQTGTVELEI